MNNYRVNILFLTLFPVSETKVCLFVDMVDSLKSQQMKEKKSNAAHAFHFRIREIYRLHVIEGVCVSDLVKKMRLSRSSIYRAIATFEANNPLESSMMKKQSKDIKPEDYQKLLDEVSSLKKKLSEERLRADFYQEMVAFGKDVYGIDLKKVGTK